MRSSIKVFSLKSKAFKITAAIAVVIIAFLVMGYINVSRAPLCNSIVFREDVIYLQENMSYSLTPQTEPYNASRDDFTYICSDSDVVTISDNGVVTPLEEGTCYIYCYDNSSKIKSNTLTVKVVYSVSDLISSESGENEDEMPHNYKDGVQWVYFTTSGSRYHLKDCPHLGERPLKTVLENAVNNGYTPCQGCFK